MCTSSVAVVWYRRDLRISDNEALHQACKSGARHLVPAYFLDPKELKPRRTHGGLSLPKLGPHRCRFLLQALHALRQSLQCRGSNLMFQIAAPQLGVVKLLQRIVELTRCQHVELYYHMDALSESMLLEEEMQAAFKAASTDLGLTCDVKAYWASTLYHPEDLPYSLFQGASTDATPSSKASQHLVWNDPRRYTSLPSVMTQFRKAVEAESQVRRCFPGPDVFPSFVPGLDELADGLGIIPTSVQHTYKLAGAVEYLSNLQEWTGHQSLGDCNMSTDSPPDDRSAVPFQGGEQQGLDRLRYYLWGSSNPGPTEEGVSEVPVAATIQRFQDTRMQAFGVDNSTKLSPYMALGCLSPRMVHAEVTRLQSAVREDPKFQCQWLLMHLCIRDFFIFTALKEGDAMMSETGIQGQPVEWKHDMELFRRWASGSTGLPFIDACMRELVATGYTSNRGRQNVASFLAKDLLIDWRLGAELFESLLIDHDVAVNYCNWNYFAGIGNDPRNRNFKTVTQGMKYDPDAQLIKAWLPELRALPPHLCHQPFSATEEEAAKFSFDLLTDYVEPLVDPQSQIGKGPKAAKE